MSQQQPIHKEGHDGRGVRKRRDFWATPYQSKAGIRHLASDPGVVAAKEVNTAEAMKATVHSVRSNLVGGVG